MKRMYEQPIVEAMLLRSESMVMAGSPGNTLPVSQTPISGGGD